MGYITICLSGLRNPILCSSEMKSLCSLALMQYWERERDTHCSVVIYVQLQDGESWDPCDLQREEKNTNHESYDTIETPNKQQMSLLPFLKHNIVVYFTKLTWTPSVKPETPIFLAISPRRLHFKCIFLLKGEASMNFSIPIFKATN